MERPLRIAIFVGSFPAVSETFIVRQIVGLLELGHEVDIYADSREAMGGPIHPEVKKHRLLSRTTFIDGPPESFTWEMPIWPIWQRTWPPGSETSIHNSSRLLRALPSLVGSFARHPRLTLKTLRPSEYSYRARSLSVLHRLAKLSQAKKRYDVLHAHFGPVGNSYRFARELWHAPLVVSFHGYDFCTLPRREGVSMYQNLFATADAITVNSGFTRRKMEKLGCPTAKLRSLPVGLDPHAFAFRARNLSVGETVRILTVARLVEIKGVEFVIRALPLLRSTYPNVQYDIVGDGPLRSRLQALVCELGLDKVVTLHGSKGGTEVREIMKDAHLFALTSVSVEGDQEGQGLVLQEAQACGLPVICTNHGAFPEGIVPGRSGFVVPERDPAAIAERLAWLIQHASHWPDLGTAGRQFVADKYDIGKLNHDLIEIYQDCIAKFKAPK